MVSCVIGIVCQTIWKEMMISFSGIDGSGKGTQIGLLETYLAKNRIRCKTIWARGSWTPGVEFIKKIVRRDRGFTEEQKNAYRIEARTNPRKQKIILILSILDLYIFWGFYYRIIRLLGYYLICDRYIWDTAVDFRVNFSNHDFERWKLWRLLLKLIPTPCPSFLLQISAEQSIQRGLVKKEAFMENLDIKKKKIEEYRALALEGKWNHVIDGTLPVEELQKVVRNSVSI